MVRKHTGRPNIEGVRYVETLDEAIKELYRDKARKKPGGPRARKVKMPTFKFQEKEQ